MDCLCVCAGADGNGMSPSEREQLWGKNDIIGRAKLTELME